MSVLVEQPIQQLQEQGHGQVSGQNNTNSDSGNSLTQITVGPAALAMLMIYQAMALYAEIIGLQAELRKSMVEAQVNSAKAQASETIAEGNAALSAAKWAGGFTIAFALVSAGAFGLLTAQDQVQNNKKMAQLNREPLQNIENKLPTDKIDLSYGENQMKGEAIDKLKEEDPQVVTRMKELKNHNYENAKNDEITEKAIARLKSGEDEEGNPFDFEKWESRVLKSSDAKKQEANTIAQGFQTKTQIISTITGTMTATGQGASQIAQGYGSAAQAQHRAASGRDQVASQMSGASAQESAQAMNKAYDSEIQEVQTLKEIDRSNSVNA